MKKFSAFCVTLVLAFVPSQGFAADPWVSGVTTITVGSNGSLSATHPNYGSHGGYTVFDYYFCDSAASFSNDASRKFSQSVGNGNQTWPLVVSGVSSATAGVTIQGATGCRWLGMNTSVNASHDGKYIMAASRTSDGTNYFYVFSNTVQYNHPWGTVTSASVRADGMVVSLMTSNAQSGNSGQTSEFVVSADGSPVTIASISRQGNQIDLNLQTPIGRNAAVTVAKVSNIWAAYNIQAFAAMSATNNSSVTIQSGSGAQTSQAPKYSGPEFTSFGSATLAGNKLVTSGKKLDTITSMKINGSAVTYKINSASELEIDLPKDLAPGKYDVEITSIHGKLTHLQGITIKAVVPTKELAFKAEGAWLNYGSLLELTNIAKQIGSEYTSVKCVVNAADPVVAERLAKRACSYIEANRLRGKAVTYESKSTYKGEGFWVRVVANG